MLHLIGIGAKKENLTHEMLSVIKKADNVYLEFYTSFYQDSVAELEKFIGKKIVICNREFIENKIEKEIIEPAKTKENVLLVMGDPLIATTHTDLLLRAKEHSVKTKVYPNISIANHITKTGLQFYKFGKITSIPFYSTKFMPRTPFLVYMDNFKMGAHSLFLLDMTPAENKYLTVTQAFEFLLEIPMLMKKEEEIEEKESQLLDDQIEAVVCSRLGFDDELIVYDTIENLVEMDHKNKFREPVCIIIPGDLHEMEEEFLKQFKVEKKKNGK